MAMSRCHVPAAEDRAPRRVPRVALAVCVALVGCGSDPAGETESGGWVGTVTTEGSVTTVINEAGSVWGGAARLEERASIGVYDGDDACLLGRIGGVWAEGGEIFVVDTQVPALRVYDWDGRHLRDIGRGGEGPGELADPYWFGGDGEGRLFVFNISTRRVGVFSTGGEHLGDWPMGSIDCCIFPMVVGNDGRVYLDLREWDLDRGLPLQVLQRHGPDGPEGEPVRPPEFDLPAGHVLHFDGRAMPVTLAPQVKWALSHDLAIIAGANHEYRFEIREPDGRRVIVERRVEPVPFDGEERDWYRRSTIASLRRGQPGWNWDGAEMPDLMPYFVDFLPTRSGEIWVTRFGPSERLPTCDPDANLDDFRAFHEAECFRFTQAVDVFGRDGRYLGEVELPEGINLSFAFPWIRDDTVIANVYDEDGLIRVVRYEIVYPDGP